MLVKSKTHICPSVPKGCIVEVLQEREGAYKIQYMNVNSKKVINAWVNKSDFEPVNDICGVTDVPGIEKVKHPKHYNKGIEVWDYTDSWKMDFLEGNIIKYITRYKHKNGIEDLKKAKQYIERLIEREVNKNGEIEK